jgi:hyaluronan synthase
MLITYFISLVGLFLLAWAIRLWFWWGYRPVQCTDDQAAAWPRLAVVIPAFNEGQMVKRAIRSVLESDYPAESLQVIAVDDGSDDDTHLHMQTMAKAHPQRVLIRRLPRNCGKRHALYRGFREAASWNADVVATLDSDSMLRRDSLRQLVVPLMKDCRIAGVAGKVVAYNRQQNLLTRMLGVRYILGFDFIRAYQSQLRTVWCCPGALQAYRLAVIAPQLERWRSQRFLGAACTNGDDHAMTNLVLSLGHDTVYQSNAVVETIVPSTYMGLCKMYVRWGRSATREGLRAMRFAPARACSAGLIRGSLIFMDALFQPLTIGCRIAAFLLLPALLMWSPMAIAKGMLATTVMALLYCLVFLRSERSLETFFALLYTWYAMLMLPWIQPFATLTVRKNGWMTRGTGSSPSVTS